MKRTAPDNSSLFERSAKRSNSKFQSGIEYFPSFFDKARSDRYLERLRNEIKWNHEEIMMFGRKIFQPRLTACYGTVRMKYAGIEMDPTPWTETLLEIKTAVETETKMNFTTALLNNYR